MLCQRLLVQGHGYPGVHKVQPAGQSGQHPGRVLLAAGLAQHPVVDGHHGVGGDDQGAGVGGGHSAHFCRDSCSTSCSGVRVRVFKTSSSPWAGMTSNSLIPIRSSSSFRRGDWEARMIFMASPHTSAPGRR